MRSNPYPMRCSFVSREEALRAVARVRELAAERAEFKSIVKPWEDGMHVGETSKRVFAQWRPAGVFGRCPAINLLGAEIMDVCQEGIRARSRYRGHKSPVQLWEEAGPATVKKLADQVRIAKRQGGTWPPLTPRNMRYWCGRVLPYCAHFRGDLCHDFLQWSWRLMAHSDRGPIDKARPRRLRWMDPCAGWGCRLLAACTSPVVGAYRGYDPNSALERGHRMILDLCGQEYASVEYKTWEEAADSVEMCTQDLVFTSPPFFDKEHYHCRQEDKSKQASEAYKTKEDFARDFVRALVEKSYGALCPGGILALHLPADGTIDRMAEAWAHRLRMQKVGVLGIPSSTGNGLVRPVYVWMK